MMLNEFSFFCLIAFNVKRTPFALCMKIPTLRIHPSETSHCDLAHGLYFNFMMSFHFPTIRL